MKIKTIKSLCISSDELKEALCDWLFAHMRADLAHHMNENLCEFDFIEEGGDLYLTVDMDGTFDETTDEQLAPTRTHGDAPDNPMYIKAPADADWSIAQVDPAQQPLPRALSVDRDLADAGWAPREQGEPGQKIDILNQK